MMLISLRLMAYFYVKRDKNQLKMLPELLEKECEWELAGVCVSKNQFYYPHIKYCDELCVEYLHSELKMQFTKEDIVSASKRNNLRILEYLVIKGPELIDDTIINYVISEGNFEKYLIIKPFIKTTNNYTLLTNSTLNYDIFIDIYKMNAIPITLWLPIIISSAVINNNIQILRFLYDNHSQSFKHGIDIGQLFESNTEIVQFMVDRMDKKYLEDIVTPQILNDAIQDRSIGKMKIALELLNNYYKNNELVNGDLFIDPLMMSMFPDCDNDDYITEAVNLAYDNQFKLGAQYLLSI